jgi:hypothetical protein
MDFQITLPDRIETREQFEYVMDLLRQELAYWNNLTPDKSLTITFQKVPNKTDTLGVAVDDYTKVTAIVK